MPKTDTNFQSFTVTRFHRFQDSQFWNRITADQCYHWGQSKLHAHWAFSCRWRTPVFHPVLLQAACSISPCSCHGSCWQWLSCFLIIWMNESGPDSSTYTVCAWREQVKVLLHVFECLFTFYFFAGISNKGYQCTVYSFPWGVPGIWGPPN